MRILYLCNRYTCRRDIFVDDFGYVVRLGEGLVARGHEVHIYAADYRKHQSFVRGLHGITFASKSLRTWNLPAYFFDLFFYARRTRPDIIISTSHSVWGLAGWAVSRIIGVPFIHHFEDTWHARRKTADIASSLFVKFLVPRANAIICISDALCERARSLRAREIYMIPQGFDPKMFRPINKDSSRRRLDLPADKRIIAYTGSIDTNRGIDTLLAAFKDVKAHFPDTMLCLYGHVYPNVRLDLTQPGVMVGNLKQEDVVYAINAADVVVLPNSDNDFARCCFPYKILEYLACERPIVASKVGVISKILGSHPECLFEPGDASDLASKLVRILDQPPEVDGFRELADGYSWVRVSGKLESVLSSVMANAMRK